jgi:Peptidase family M28
MIKNTSLIFILFLGVISILSSCKPDPGSTDKPKEPKKKAQTRVQVKFDADSAYHFVDKQVAFGPRVPGTLAHQQTMNYLLKKLNSYCDTAFINSGDIMVLKGTKVLIKNVIGSFNPESKNRIVLAAHWDTRPIAEEDPVNKTTPADGANDGGSGVGVLLEIARQLQKLKPQHGIDIIFFDQEDNGDRTGNPDTWCLGSQFWGNWAVEHRYEAEAGILLDMVGAKGATFGLEGHSIAFNHNLVLKVWKNAQRLGYGGYFINIDGGLITDDHFYMNTIAGVPSIDIIHHDLSTESGFPDNWHTHADNMNAIDKNTLKAVGHTVLDVVVHWR